MEIVTLSDTYVCNMTKEQQIEDSLIAKLNDLKYSYRSDIKAKLKMEKKKLVSATTQLKLTATDGKKYLTDTIDSEGVVSLAKSFPNSKAMVFLDWFLYSDNSIDGQSKKKATLCLKVIYLTKLKLALPKDCNKYMLFCLAVYMILQGKLE